MGRGGDEQCAPDRLAARRAAEPLALPRNGNRFHRHQGNAPGQSDVLFHSHKSGGYNPIQACRTWPYIEEGSFPKE